MMIIIITGGGNERDLAIVHDHAGFSKSRDNNAIITRYRYYEVICGFIIIIISAQ